jgi:hypothetical protein
MADFANLVLGVDTSGLKRGERALNDTTKAGGRTERAVKGTGRGFDRAGRSASTATPKVAAFGAATDATRGMALAATRALTRMVVGLGAVIAAGASLSKFVDATVTADRSQAQLAATILSTGGAANKTIQQLNAHASALQGVTNFGDEATNAMQGLLLTFTKIQGGTFDRATVAVMDVATALGSDLQSAALQVGKALNDPILGLTALSRSGIQFTQSQKDVVKALVDTNNVAAAQALILDELDKQFGGSAAAARDTLGGALTSLGNAFGDLFEISSEGSKDFRLAIESLITTIAQPNFIAAIQGIGIALFAFAEAGIKVLGFLSRFITSISSTVSILTTGIAKLLGFSEATTQVGLASNAAALAIAEEVKQADLLLSGLVEGREYSVDYIGVKLAQAQAHLAVADSARQENIEIAKGSAEFLRLQGIIDGARVAMADFQDKADQGVPGIERMVEVSANILRTAVASQEALLDGLQETTPEFKAIQAEIDYINGLLEGSVDGVVLFEGGLIDTTAAAIDVNAELTKSLKLLARIDALGPQQSSAGRGRGGDPRDFGGSILDRNVQEADAFIASLDQLERSAGRAGPKIEKVEEELTKAELAAIAAAEAFDQKLTSAVDSLASAFGDFVTSGFQDFKGMMDSILSSFKSMISQMIATAVANPIKMSLGIGAGGTGGAVAGMGGGGSLLSTIGAGGGLAGSFLSGGAGLVTSMMGGGGLASAGTYLSAVTTGATASMGAFAAAAGAVLLPLAAVVGAVLFFKKKTKELDAGVQVTVNELDILVESFKTIETSRFFGLSKKVNDEFEELSDAASAPLRKVITDIQTSVLGGAAALGIAADAFDGFSTQITLSTKGLSEEEATAAMVDALRGVADEFASMIPQLAGLQREGEGAFDTLQRLGTSLSATNAVFDMLGLGLIDVSIAGAQASTAFTDVFGSIQNLNAASNAYFTRFFSDAEQSAFMTEQVGSALASLGQIMPTTIAQFRSLVEQARAVGDFERVGQLIALAPAFAAAFDAAKVLVDADQQRIASLNADAVSVVSDFLANEQKELEAARDNAQRGLEAAFTREMQMTRDTFATKIDALNETLTGARERLANSRAISDALSDALDSRLFPSIEAQRQSQDSASAFLQSLVGQAEINDLDALQKALRTVSIPSQDTFATLAEFTKDFNTTSGVIDALEKTAGFALTTEEQTVLLLEKQIADTQLQSDQAVVLLEQQLNALTGLADNIISLADAIRAFEVATAAVATPDAAVAATGAISSAGSDPLTAAYQAFLGRAPDLEGRAYFSNLLQNGVPFSTIAGNIAGSPEAQRFANTHDNAFPSFAGGGYTGDGSRTGGIDGQGGFMAMMHPQETVTDHTRGSVNAKLEAQLELLNQKIVQLTAYQKQTTINTGNTSFDVKDIRRNGVQVEPVDGAIFKTDEVA